MDWKQTYTFCERVYDHLLIEARASFNNTEVITSLSQVKECYTDELNIILAEENIAYQFVEGKFHRRGRAQTQKSAQRVGVILIDPLLSDVRKYYNKALVFFREFPEPDIENCVKEALCALEACLEVLSKKPASRNFAKVVKQLQGNSEEQIPSPIAEGLIKLHAYRGSGQGVAHAALKGNKVSEVEAELVLNLVASYITYLYDLFSPSDEEIPF
ncbi:MAG: hypothetical protein GY833_04840 [Aestuariibacter sp.]|nr:hypothetical protein [Aestuariibacter sp.]